MTVTEFLSIEWSSPGDPLIEPPRFSPVIADPSYLFPEETPDGEWALFAHSAWGIHRYSSADGIAWRDRGLVVRHAMRPFVRPIGERAGLGTGLPARRSVPFVSDRTSGGYLLLFESYEPFALVLTALPGRRRWKSSIASALSADLRRWTRAETVLSPSLPWMRDAALGDSVSNPCLIEDGDGFRLYFSASLSWIEDCGFCEPRYIGHARGRTRSLTDGGGVRDSFTVDEEPVIDPADDDLPGVLGAGSLKALKMDDGFIGLQNKIFKDEAGRSRSAIFVLRSDDGVSWRSGLRAPLLAPESGWTSSHVYACDCRYRRAEDRWYLYFNARDGWRIRDGVERIGRIVGRKNDGPSRGKS